MAKLKVRSSSIRGVYNMQQCHHINIYYQRARNAAELDTAYHRLMIDRAPSMPDLSDGCNAMQCSWKWSILRSAHAALGPD